MANKKQTSLVKWDEQLAKEAILAAGVEANVGGGSFIGTAGGRLKVKGAFVPDNKLECVIVDHIIEYAYYEGDFDPENPQPPVCFAFGRDEKTLVPHTDVTEKQHETCTGCPQNEWASAKRGKGKACKNGRRLALITSGDLDNLAKAEVMYLKVPVTSVRGWAGYVRNLADTLHKPPMAFVTEISLVPDAKNQFSMAFKTMEEIKDGSVIGQLFELRKKVSGEIDFPYQAAQKQERSSGSKTQKRKKF